MWTEIEDSKNKNKELYSPVKPTFLRHTRHLFFFFLSLSPSLSSSAPSVDTPGTALAEGSTGNETGSGDEMAAACDWSTACKQQKTV